MDGDLGPQYMALGKSLTSFLLSTSFASTNIGLCILEGIKTIS
jgi:hypothetical protein